MNKPSVTQFISDKRAEGKNDSQITHMLLDAGWHIDVIHKAIHGEPIKKRNLEPILIPKLQRHRYKIYAIVGGIGLILLMLVATFI